MKNKIKKIISFVLIFALIFNANFYFNIKDIFAAESSVEEENIIDDDIEYDNSTPSDAAILNNVVTATESNVDYDSLDTISQILYFDKDAASYENNTIIFKKDLEINRTIKITEDLKFNIGEYSIVATDNNYATISVKNANVTFENGKIVGAIGGGNAIESIDSNIEINGSKILGGDGKNENKEKGGNGGDAILFSSSNNHNTLKILSGEVHGGNGGDGKGKGQPYAGAALLVGNEIYNDKTLVKGSSGEIGGGDGGNAIYIKNFNYNLSYVNFPEYMIFAGSAGKSITPIFKSLNLKGAVGDPVYDLRKVSGKNYLTKLKSQSGTTLCTAYATVASAETQLLKRYPEYLKSLGYNVGETLARTTWNNNIPSNKEVDFSEIQFGMNLYRQAKDEFLNAGSSKNLINENNWANCGGSTEEMMICNLASWRTLVAEDSSITWSTALNQAKIDSYTNKTLAHVKNTRMYNYKDYYDSGNTSQFVNDVKQAINDYDGACLGLYFTGSDTNNTTDSYTTTNYNGWKYYYATETTGSHGGHEMFIFGWDDNIKVKVSGIGSEFTGAFLAKDSYNNFALIPYNNNWAIKEGGVAEPNLFSVFLGVEWMPAFTEYENNYFYDGGLYYSDALNKYSYSALDASEMGYDEIWANVQYGDASIANIFRVRNNKEKLKSISYISYGKQNVNVKVYKINSFDINGLKNVNPSGLIWSGDYSVETGLNNITLGSGYDVVKDDCIAVIITDKSNTSIRSAIDKNTNDISIFRFETVFENKSFIGKPTLLSGQRYTRTSPPTFIDDNFDDGRKNAFANKFDWEEVSDSSLKYNFRIKLLTNNYVELNASEGTIGGDPKTYYYPDLRASMSTLPTPVPTDTDKEYKKYTTNSDGSGTVYTKNSVYKLDIAKNLVLHAQYGYKPKYNITLNPMGGTINSGNITEYNYGVVTNLTTDVTPSATDVAAGKHFAGWYDSSNNKVTKITATDHGDKNLHAVYSTSFTITFVAGGGSGTMPPQSGEADHIIKLNKNTFTRLGYNFNVWKDQNGITYKDTETFTLSCDLTLTAQWILKNTDTGGGGSGGGGGGGGGTRPAQEAVVPEKKLTAPAEPMQSAISTNCNWVKDAMGNWHLTINGEINEVKNRWCQITTPVTLGTEVINVVDYYFFDESGKMLSGWLTDEQNNTYFLDNSFGSEGKMVTGWKMISGKHYYFNGNGTLLKGGMTPDGYMVDANGAWLG